MGLYIDGQLHEWVIEDTDIDPIKKGFTIEGRWHKKVYNHYCTDEQGKKRKILLINKETNKQFNFTEFLTI